MEIQSRSSYRWRPTDDQARILRELYFNDGVRSPNSEQIQWISARLGQYGEIEDKNVFYWFQNHRARERQNHKKSMDQYHHLHLLPSPPTNSKSSIYDDNEHHTNIINPNPGSSASVCIANGHPANYGSMTVDYPFGECSVLPKESKIQSLGNWVTEDHHPRSYWTFYDFFNKKKWGVSDKDGEEYEKDDRDKQRTLLLFPMHGEEPNQSAHTFCSGWCGANFGNPTYANEASFDSLELSLSPTYANEASFDSLELSLSSYPRTHA